MAELYLLHEKERLEVKEGKESLQGGEPMFVVYQVATRLLAIQVLEVLVAKNVDPSLLAANPG